MASRAPQSRPLLCAKPVSRLLLTSGHSNAARPVTQTEVEKSWVVIWRIFLIVKMLIKCDVEASCGTTKPSSCHTGSRWRMWAGVPTPPLTLQQAQNKVAALLPMYSFKVVLIGCVCWPRYGLSHQNKMSKVQRVLCSVNDNHFQNTFNLFQWPVPWQADLMCLSIPKVWQTSSGKDKAGRDTVCNYRVSPKPAAHTALVSI